MKRRLRVLAGSPERGPRVQTPTGAAWDAASRGDYDQVGPDRSRGFVNGPRLYVSMGNRRYAASPESQRYIRWNEDEQTGRMRVRTWSGGPRTSPATVQTVSTATVGRRGSLEVQRISGPKSRSIAATRITETIKQVTPALEAALHSFWPWRRTITLGDAEIARAMRAGESYSLVKRQTRTATQETIQPRESRPAKVKEGRDSYELRAAGRTLEIDLDTYVKLGGTLGQKLAH